MDRGSDEKRMRLRYPGSCRVCGVELPARAEAIYEPTSKSVRCVGHDVTTEEEPLHVGAVDDLVPEVVQSGTAGTSARREFERRRVRREERNRAKHPRLRGLILAVSEEPQSTTAWDVGALGEERLGSGLDRLTSDVVRLLHDRRIPRSRVNIDHIAVTATGVYVIDAKRYRGRPHLKIEGGVLRPRVERLRWLSRLNQTRRRGTQAGRHRAEAHRGRGTGSWRSLPPRCELASVRRKLHHARRASTVVQEDLSPTTERRPLPAASIAQLHQTLARQLSAS